MSDGRTLRAGTRPAVPGTVYLVGAGPGDPGLLTVRALDLVRQADVVLHDHLVSAEILAECAVRARVISVGKIGHGPQTDQTAIERQIIAFARDGCRVVRLKGGDPLLFGRGSEEAAALRAAHVPFEIVPGVSSALAAPAYAGIPLTARGVAASVAIMTGHCAGSGASPLAIPTADTLVVLMGVANSAALRDQLIAAGRSGAPARDEWARAPARRSRPSHAAGRQLPARVSGSCRSSWRDGQVSIGARLARSSSLPLQGWENAICRRVMEDDQSETALWAGAGW